MKESRTKHLADYLISRMNNTIWEVCLSEIDFPKTDEAFLKRRNAYIRENDYSDRCLVRRKNLQRRIRL